MFGHKWRISAPGIVISNPKIIDLFIYMFYGGPHKGGFEIVNDNPGALIVHLCRNSTLLTLLKVHLSVRYILIVYRSRKKKA